MTAPLLAQSDGIQEGPSATARAVVTALQRALPHRLALMEQRWGHVALGPEPRSQGLNLTIGETLGESRPQSYPAVQVGVTRMLSHHFQEWGPDGAPISQARYQCHAWCAVEGDHLDTLARARERLVLAVRHSLTVSRALDDYREVVRNSVTEHYLQPAIVAAPGQSEQPQSAVAETRIDFTVIAVERPSVPVLGTADTIAVTAETLPRS
ncbi:MAG: hypothetical protein M3256_12295 [Actinomycetota bacterium]|nr:hypothetical protein [Actinomycetota bacterium]